MNIIFCSDLAQALFSIGIIICVTKINISRLLNIILLRLLLIEVQYASSKHANAAKRNLRLVRILYAFSIAAAVVVWWTEDE